MTPDQPAVPPTPGVRVEFTWAATDGSAPESASVWWEHVIPPPEEICQVIAALAQSADRYELTDPEPGEQILSPVDLCLRASCGHPRQHHPRNGACNICAEGEGCAVFLDVPPALTFVHEGRIHEVPPAMWLKRNAKTGGDQ